MRAIFLFVAGSALMLGGCGGGDEPREPPPAPVRLTVTAPSDATTVRAEGVEVRGTVSPARARVLVRGRRVRVTDGAFAASVPLKEGANVIDVAASARGSAPAWSAVRITRRTTVTVPDLAGTEAELAAGELRRIGLRRGRRRGRRPVRAADRRPVGRVRERPARRRGGQGGRRGRS